MIGRALSVVMIICMAGCFPTVERSVWRLTREPINVAAATSWEIAGRVTDSLGHPLVGATVRIRGTAPMRGAICGEDGWYRIAGIPCGIYDVMATFPGTMYALSRGLVIDATAIIRLDFALAPADISSDTVVMGDPTPPIDIGSVTKIQHTTRERLDAGARPGLTGTPP